MSTILITGGSGLVGRALTDKLLAGGDEVIVLSRSKRESTRKGLYFAQWNIDDQIIDEGALIKADYIIHLAGAGVADKRWTKKRKKQIQNSRVHSSRLLANSLLGLKHKVKAIASASAIGWYGPDKGGGPFKESDLPASDFLGQTCRLWEEAVERIGESGIRVVKLRTGLVLSRKGGALKEFLKPMKFGIAPILGNGKQVMSWIHINDLVDLYIYALKNDNIIGSYNAVSPHWTSNKQFIKTISKARKRVIVPVKIPSLLLKMVLGEMSIEVLKSCTVSAEKTLKTGFRFQYPNVDIAAKMLFG